MMINSVSCIHEGSFPNERKVAKKVLGYLGLIYLSPILMKEMINCPATKFF